MQRTAIDLSTKNNVVVVGTDLDLLIMLIQLSKEGNQLYIYEGLQPTRKKKRGSAA